MKTILIDPDQCIECRNCQNACKDEHCDNDWSPLTARQSEGQFWIRIEEREVCSGTRVRMERVPILCQHCLEPACVASCPEDAIYRRDDGIVIIDPQACTGCGTCIEGCRYGVVFHNPSLGIAQKCTFCAHLLDAGWDRPRCVTACPTDALAFVDDGDLVPENLSAPLERLHPEYGYEPRIAYVNLPKPFIAGEVFSPSEDLCLENVELELTGMANKRHYRGTSNFLGEFRIGSLEPGFYELTLRKAGYVTKTIAKLDARNALDLKEVRLYLQGE